METEADPWRTNRQNLKSDIPPPPDLNTEISFGFIDRHVMAAVERVAASDPIPAIRSAGSTSPTRSRCGCRRATASLDADERLQEVVRALGLDLLEAAVLAVCAATELNPRYGRLYAYLQNDVTRKLPSRGSSGNCSRAKGSRPPT